MLKDRIDVLLEFRIWHNRNWVCISALDTAAGTILKCLNTRATEEEPLIISLADWRALPIQSNMWVT
jgi:hypothetical protein